MKAKKGAKKTKKQVRKGKKELEKKIDDLVADVLECNQFKISQATRYGEDELEGYKTLLKKIKKHTGNAHVIGITGFPGAGKSSLIRCLIKEYVLNHDKKVGVIAVDPSALSGGAVLGDRVRMQIPELEPFDERVYIRSMAARGHKGGLAKSTGYIVSLLDAAGYDKIFVETVGAGQNDIDIMNLAHTSIVVVNPGMGDIQTLKGGIMEIADLYVVNKADNDGAYITEKEIKSYVSLSKNADWEPRVYQTIANKKNPPGVKELIEGIEEHYKYIKEKED